MRKLKLLLGLIPLLAFVACDKGDMEVKKLNRGEGIWSIESVMDEFYDSTGANVTSRVTYNDVGEFIFFKSTTLNALFDEHFMVLDLFDSAGVVTAYTGGVYYDDSRAKISTDQACWLEGVWTVTDNGRKSQVWTLFGSYNNGVLYQKRTMSLKKK